MLDSVVLGAKVDVSNTAKYFIANSSKRRAAAEANSNKTKLDYTIKKALV